MLLRSITYLIIFSALATVNMGCVQKSNKKQGKTSAAAINREVSITYSQDSLFESNLNNGVISEVITLSLVGGKFTSPLGSMYEVKNLPIGLISSLTRTSDKIARLTISGQALSHNLEDSKKIELTLDSSAILSDSNSFSSKEFKHPMNLVFFNPPKIIYSGLSFLEGVNNSGEITESRTITLVGDTFSRYLIGKYQILNVPQGLRATLRRDSNTQLTLSFSGQAISHATENSIYNVSVRFFNSAFTLTDRASKVIGYFTPNIKISFYTLARLDYSRTIFSEALKNDGSIIHTAVINLSGDSFSRNLQTSYTTDNLPAGLNLSIERLTNNQALLSFSGQSTQHGSADNISNLTVTFLSSAFKNIQDTSTIANYLGPGLSIQYFNEASLDFTGSSFSEKYSNNGSVSGSSFIFLNNDKFANDLKGKYTITNLPRGLYVNLRRVSDFSLELTLQGNSLGHASRNSVSNLTLTFLDQAFQNTRNASAIGNYQKTDFSIGFFSTPAISYNLRTFTEDPANPGAIINICEITLVNDQFSSDLSKAFQMTGHPSGLTPILIRNSDKKATLKFIGNANKHDGSNNKTAIQFTFKKSAFIHAPFLSYIRNHKRNDFQVMFNDPVALSYSRDVLNESGSNDGSIEETIVVTLNNDIFAENMGGKYILTNIPAGLVPRLNRDSSTQLTLSFSGKANLHDLGNSSGRISLIFKDQAFVETKKASGVLNYAKSNISIIFMAAPALNYSRKIFNENPENEGGIDETATIILTNDTFTPTISNKYSFLNVPAGLTGILERVNDNQLTLSFSGNAEDHYSSFNTNNIQLTFQESIFTKTSDASNVKNGQVNNLSINYKDPTLSGSDPLVIHAWHLQNTGQRSFAISPGMAGQDINTPPQTIDLTGETGSGIKVAISDSGVEITHEDLASNNDASKNKNYNNTPLNWNGPPTPIDSHGTMVTGLISAIAKNGLGSRGVAPGAKFSGFTFVGISTPSILTGIDQTKGDFDIFNYSYGRPQCLGTFEDPGLIAQLKDGVTNLRSGKGANYVKAAGNSFIASLHQTCPTLVNEETPSVYRYAGNANLNNAMAYPWQLIVGALNAKGTKSSYSSPGANIWISAPGGEFGSQNPAMVTTDQTGCNVGTSLRQKLRPINSFEVGLNPSLNPDCRYTSTMNGTSSSAPIVSGVIALMLEANASLSYRDVRKILAETARKVDLNFRNNSNPLNLPIPSGHIYEPGWVTNAANYSFHNWYGFGAIDAKRAVMAAKMTQNLLPPLKESSSSSGELTLSIPDNDSNGVSNIIKITSSLTVESVQINPLIFHNLMGEVGVELISPSGTKSILLSLNTNMAMSNWRNAELLSNAFYGEPANGDWTIKVIDGDPRETGVLQNWGITIYGHE